MSESDTVPGEFNPRLAERLAPMSIAEIDAGTDEYAAALVADVGSGRARVIQDRGEIHRRLLG